MYGITREQLTDFFLELRRANPLVATDTDLRCLSSSLAMCALNCTWEQLYDLQPMWIAPETPPLSIRTLRDDFSRIAELCRSPALMNPKLRFEHGISWLSDVTCMMDVTTIPCRARKPRDVWDEALQEKKTKDSTYSGKHRERCFKVEFWLTLAGVPIFFRGPVPGSVHDAKIYKERTTHGAFLFDQHEQEMFLADLGYVGCPRYKKLYIYRGENLVVGGGLKFVKIIQFWKVIAHSRALTELYVLALFAACDST